MSLGVLPRPALWSLTTAEVLSVPCPTCGSLKRTRCVTLRDRPVATLHRGRISRYLDIRFGLRPAPGPRREAPRAPARIARPVPDHVHGRVARPWLLPLEALTDLVNVSFLDLAKVVAAEACGVDRDELMPLLYGPDRITDSIDALTYALHDLTIRQEIRLLTLGDDVTSEQLGWQRNAVQRRLSEAENTLKRHRVAELDAAGLVPDHNTAPTDDPERLARTWLGRYLREERDELIRQIAAGRGLSPHAFAYVGSVSEKIERAVSRGLLAAPVNDQVAALRTMGDAEFRAYVTVDASRQQGRDDALCHPLVLPRWRAHLAALSTHLAPKALNASSTALVRLPWTRMGAYSGSRLEDLRSRRTQLGAVIQRSRESHRLEVALNDAVSLAEAADPQQHTMDDVVVAALDRLQARHHDLYRVIEECVQPHVARTGLMAHRDPERRGQLRRDVFAALDRQVLCSPAGAR